MPWSSWPSSSTASGLAAASCSRPGLAGESDCGRGRCSTSCPRRARSARASGRSRRLPTDMQQRWVEITGPTDRKMTINALNSGADGFMADFEDANAPTLAEHGRRSPEPAGRDRWNDHLPRFRRQGLRAGREPGHAAGPPARLAPPRAPPAGRLRARHRRIVRLRPVRLPLRAAAGAGRQRSLLLSPEDGVAPRGPAVERRVPLRPGVPGHPARHDQGDRADRDAAGCVRDGRDPLRAARAFRRAERRPLGLHLLGHQVLPQPPRDGSARPRST